MRYARYVLPAIGVLVAAWLARAGDADAARALVEKAVEAQGGYAKLAKLQGVSAKLKGTFHALGEASPFTGELAFDGKSRQKVVIETKAADEKFVIIHVLDGDKGWIKTNDDTLEMDEDELAEAKEEAYSAWVATLLPLKDKAFTLTPISEVQVGKRPALGVKVASKRHRDVKLYFDKKTGLLVRTLTRVKNDSGEEVPEETILSDYKDVQGTKQAMKLAIRQDGELQLEAEVTEYRLTERLDDRVFAKP